MTETQTEREGTHTPVKNSDRLPIVIFGLLLLGWPIGALIAASWDSPSVLADNSLFYGYVLFSTLLYPVFYLVSFVVASQLKHKRADHKRVLRWAYFPLLSAYPWLAVFIILNLE
ncbi:MAG: hypothetical protein AAGL69_09420 [Pseudomonadota bacterium]